MSSHAKANILKRSRELNERVVYSAIKTRVSMFRKKIKHLYRLNDWNRFKCTLFMLEDIYRL